MYHNLIYFEKILPYIRRKKMDFNLIGKYALVGGGSKGIGNASAKQLAKLGANVILIARSKESLESAVKDLPSDNAQHHSFIVGDFSKPESICEDLKALLEKHSIHIFVNNTGGPAGGPIIEASKSAFASAFHQHIVAAQLIASTLLPSMKKSGYGRVINIISTSVKEPIAGLGVSNTIRAAMGNWAKTWSQEVGTYGITVNNVLPGYTLTDRLDNIIQKKAKRNNTSPDDITIQMKRNVPLRRFGEAGEIGAAVAFLASPAASYINGINLPVDGGRTKSL